MDVKKLHNDDDPDRDRIWNHENIIVRHNPIEETVIALVVG